MTMAGSTADDDVVDGEGQQRGRGGGGNDDDDGGTDGNGNNGNGNAISREEASRIVDFVKEERMVAAMCFDDWSR